MAVYRVFDAFNDANWGDVQLSPAYVVGTCFQVTRPMFLTHVGWYRSHTGTTGAPTTIGVWDTVSQACIWQTNAFSDSNTVAWQWTALSAPLGLQANREYRVAVLYANNQYHARYTLGSVPTPPSPLAWGANYRCYAQSGTWQYPSTGAGQFLQAVDVKVDDTGTGDIYPPATTGDITAGLAPYFDPETASVTLGSGYTYPESVDEIISRLGGASANWAGTVSTIINAIKDQTDLLPAGIAQLTAAWLDDLLAQATNANDLVQQIVAGTAGTRMALDGGGSAFGPTYDQVDAIAGQIADLLTTGEQLAAYWDFPGTPWAMSDEQAFDTNLAYAEPAHLYVVTFNDLGANVVNTVVAGVDVSYRLAWWTPLAGANAHQRRFIDTPSAHLYDNGHKMPGILLCSQAGGSGTIQAWSRF